VPGPAEPLFLSKGGGALRREALGEGKALGAGAFTDKFTYISAEQREDKKLNLY
jgi:hypothetical protein